MQPRNYYYFVATLPWLNYGEKPPLSSGDFREQCKAMLDPEDAALLRYCCFDPVLAIETVKSTGSEFVDRLLERERTLIFNMACLRAAKLKRPAPGIPPHDIPRTEAVAKAVVEMEDPLEAELYMDQSRWVALDEMVGIDLFGLNNIFAFLLKLQLMERRQLFEVERGQTAYRELYGKILNEYNSRV